MAGVTLEAFGLPSWEELEEARARFVEDVCARVVEWQFARDTALWESPRPLLAERLGYKPVKAMQKEPKDWSRVMRYGLDGDGKVVCAQSFSEGSGPTAQMYTEGLAVDIDGWRVHLTFDVSSHPARLRDVTVEERADGRLMGTTMIMVQASSSRERYSYDDAGRLLHVVRHNVEYGVIESWTEERVTYAPDGSVKRIAERQLKPGEVPVTFDEHDVVRAEEEPATAEQAGEARGRLERSLVTAVVAWGERMPQDVNRILLLHDWPSNPPLPPGLSARTDALTPAADPWELFDPDPSGQLLESDPREFDDEQLRADCQILNDWYEQSDDRNPIGLLVAVARRAQAELAAHRGHAVWVIPVDKDREALPAAVQELLPASVSEGLLLKNW